MTSQSLVFGWRTAVLTVVSGQALVIAALLLQTARNRLANRLLAALLIVVVGVLTPFTIGFAGFYDRFPWLSFAPFAVPLAVGPLVWGYATALVTGAAPRRFAWHLAPGAAQFAYQGVCFLLPLKTKTAWDALSDAWADPLISVAVIASLAVYTRLSLAALRRYRAWLGGVIADEQRFAARWLRNALAAVMLDLVAEAAYQAWEFAFGRLSYFGVFGLYLTLAAVALYLAMEGWRHAELPFPALPSAGSATAPASAPAGREKDWPAVGQAWAARIEGEGWWRDPDLTLADLAARLGVNTTYLPRALNEGPGVNFATFINTLRARAVADALAAGRSEDLLTLALEAGFNSKASFNRAFKAALGVSPSEYRRARGVSKPEHSPVIGDLRRARP
jgi:AraC-like DNA-binding protein